MNFKNKRGVTLIALIVTIIVLIIIAGISIGALTSDNGILRQTDAAKVTQIEGTAREQVKLACTAMRLAVAEASAKDNSYSAKMHAKAIQDKLVEILEADRQGLNGKFTNEGVEAANEATEIKIEYVGDDYKNACNDTSAKITYTIGLSQKTVELTNEENATLKDQNGNNVVLDIGSNTEAGSGSGTGEGDSDTGSDTDTDATHSAGIYQTGSNYTVSLYSWDELLSSKTIYVTDGTLTTNPDTVESENGSSSKLSGDLVLSDTVTKLANYAFYKCENLTSAYIPESVTNIVSAAFEGCSSLETVTFAENSQLTTIDSGIFTYCTSLANITIPTSVTAINFNAFGNCSSLSNITYLGTTSQWESITLETGWDSGAGNYTITCTDGTISK